MELAGRGHVPAGILGSSIILFYDWHHGVIVPDDHPLVSQVPLALEAIVEHPIITYHEGFTGRTRLDATFARAGLIPDIVLSALDAGAIKTCFELGFGIGIIASVAYHPLKDVGLRLLDCNHLFEQNITWIAVRGGQFLRNFVCRFIELCNPEPNESIVRNASSSVAATSLVQGRGEVFDGQSRMASPAGTVFEAGYQVVQVIIFKYFLIDGLQSDKVGSKRSW